jgi:lysophospholipase L1-like esterase
MLRILLVLLLAAVSVVAEDFLPGVQRILFLGDSITHGAQYVDDFALYLAIKHPERKFTVINCGLPSETVSGLSEAGHAGGKFPRPDLHERLDRVLATVKPDLVFACYGMNCGIYLPFSEERFAKYREGIEKLRVKVKAAGADIIHLTPAAFDTQAIKSRVVSPEAAKDGDMSADYDAVLGWYAAWLVEQGKTQGWRVIDVHTAMNNALQAARQRDPNFSFAKDGVHPNEQGHRAISGAIFKYFGIQFDPDSTAYATLQKAVKQRNRVLGDAYLSAAGHLRPGMGKGLPLPEAIAKAAEIEAAFPSVQK